MFKKIYIHKRGTKKKKKKKNPKWSKAKEGWLLLQSG